MAILSLRGRVYWSETDAAQIAHFTSFLRYCEKTEEEFIIKSTGRGWSPGSIVFPRVHASCDYNAPLRVHDEYRVDLVDVVIGEKSITYKYEVWNETLGALSAKCTIVTVAYDPYKMEAVPVPAELIEAMAKMGARKRE